MRLRSRRTQSKRELEHGLLTLSRSDEWRVRDACAGTLIFGDTGSGKTSGSGRAIALAMLRAGFGGLVLTVKPGEAKRWRENMASCGREDDLLIFSPESGHSFNFLEHEQARPTRGGGTTENIVALLVEAMNVGAEAAGSASDPFWDKALRQILRNTVDALSMAGEPITLGSLQRFVSSVPTSLQEVQDPSWQAASFAIQVLRRAEERVGDEPVARQGLTTTCRYWFEEYAGVMDDRTRGNIVSTLTTTCDGFLRGDLFRLFSMQTPLTPEASLDGKVIVLDLPLKQFHRLGKVAQVIWKLCWQRAVEERDRSAGDPPVFLWVDEAQHFVTQSDADFVMTAREQMACCVYLTQAVSNYHQAFGSGNQAAAQSFLGIPKTKIFHCNGDPVTNQWAADVISDNWQVQTQHGTSKADRQSEPQHSTSVSQSRQPKIFPADFGELASGGPPDFLVEAVLYQSGRSFRSTGSNFIRIVFDQRGKSPRRWF